jgi:hypothetical protein
MLRLAVWRPLSGLMPVATNVLFPYRSPAHYFLLAETETSAIVSAKNRTCCPGLRISKSAMKMLCPWDLPTEIMPLWQVQSEEKIEAFGSGWGFPGQKTFSLLLAPTADHVLLTLSRVLLSGIALYRDSARIDRAQVSAVFPQARSPAPRDSDFRVPDTRWHRLMKSGNPSIVVPYTPVILPRRHPG